MDNKSRIFIAGHRGLVGSALVRVFRENGYENLVLKTRAECDLQDPVAVANLFAAEKIDVVILAAAKVGGIWANNTYPYDFLAENLQIQMNVISEAHKHDVKSLVFLGSSCIYPKFAPQPIAEESLLTGKLELTNEPYAIAKITGIEMCWSLNRQFGRRYFSVMPTNLYGIEDNFDLMNSHVLPALIRKFHEAREKNAADVEVWGSGQPLREFLFNDDLAAGILYLLTRPADDLKFLFRDDAPPLINIGAGEDLSIKDLAHLVRDLTGFKGEIKFNTEKPDGTPRKLMDSSKMRGLGWAPKVALPEGVRRVVEYFAKTEAAPR